MKCPRGGGRRRAGESRVRATPESARRRTPRPAAWSSRPGRSAGGEFVDARQLIVRFDYGSVTPGCALRATASITRPSPVARTQGVTEP